MKKIIVSIIVIGLLLSMVSINTGASESGTTIYVDDDNTEGPWDGTQEHPFKNITDAMDASSNGDTVFVYSGTYTGKNIIRKTINLIGEDKNTTIIDSSYYAVKIKADGVLFSGFTIRGSHAVTIRSDNNEIIGNNIVGRYRFAIDLSQSHGNNISGNYISNFETGIWLSGSCNNTITGNVITGINHGGIELSYSDNNVISGNCLISCNNNGLSEAILLSDSSFNLVSENYIDNVKQGGMSVDGNNNIITNNTIANINGGSFSATGISIESSYNIITGNTITTLNGCWSYGIDIESSNNIVTGNTITNLNGINNVYGIETSGWGKNNNITGNTIENLNAGIFARGISLEAPDSAISKNTISNINSNYDACGIKIYYTSNVLLSENSIININTNGYVNGNGIEIYESSKNTITGNIIADCDYSNIYLTYSNSITIQENTITGRFPSINNYGILGEFATQTTISNNTIEGNTWGIYLSIGCQENIISKNTINNNAEGIGLGREGYQVGGPSDNKIIANNIIDTIYYGIYCEKGSFSNEVYYNNLINNGENAYDLGLNTWDKFKLLGKSIGNYWDDYNGVDNNGDGIGDTSYIIDGKQLLPSKDKYPAMDPFDIENIEVSYETTEEMTSEESEYLAQLEETINSQILSGELNINDLMNSYAYIVSTPSSNPTNN